MGVYIKGASKADLEWWLYTHGIVWDTRDIVDVPKPHGRLIDGKALLKDLSKRWDTNDDHDIADKEVWHALEDAPTVIEREGE